VPENRQEANTMTHFTLEATPSGGATILINNTAVLAIEPNGTANVPPLGAEVHQGQHFIANPLVGPDAGRPVRIPPIVQGAA
jgi:hypothetical protein